MAVQNSSNLASQAFILSGQSLIKDNETLLQDAGRATPLAFGTLMAKVAASGKWVPFTDETATTGAATARGVYVGDAVAAADLVAGDVVGAPILVGGSCTIDGQQLVIENSKTLGTVVGATTVNARTVRDDLERFGIFVEETIDIDGYEN